MPAAYVSPFGGNPFLVDQPQRQATPPVDPAARQGLLRQLYDTAGGAVSNLLWGLDTPGAFVRGTLAGGLGRGLSEAMSGESERTSGRELLREYGLAGDEDNWGNFFGGTAAEIVTDPLNYLLGPVKALSNAGRAADAAGLLKQAPQLVSRQFLNAADTLAPELAERAGAAATRRASALGRNALSETEVLGRPLVGRRAAQKYATLGDLIDYSSDPTEATNKVLDWLQAQKKPYDLDALRQQKLGGDIGIAPSFLHDARATVNIPVLGDLYSDAADSLGSALRWTGPGRHVAALTNNAVGGQTDAASQAAFAGAYQVKSEAQREARREAAYQAAKLYQYSPETFTTEGNRSLGRLIEQPVQNANQAADDALVAGSPAIRNYLDWWDEKAAELPEEFRQVGLNGALLEDPNVKGYLPRRLDGVLKRESTRPGELGRLLSTMTPDQMARTEALKIPGGRDTIAFDLSLDPAVAGPKRSLTTDQAAADHIASKLFGAPGSAGLSKEQQSQAMDLARLLHKLPDTATGQSQLFAQHPTKSIMDYTAGRAGAKAVAESIYDSLATITKNTPAPAVEGGNHIPLSEALNRFGVRSTKDELGEVGAKQQMRQRLAELYGGDPDKLELNKFSVPEQDVNRLLKARESFTSPQAVNDVDNWLVKYNRWFKGGVLARPRRYMRDFISGTYSNWLEGAMDARSFPITRHILDAFSSTPYVTARELAAKSAFDPEFVEFLGQMPRYASYPPSDRAARYYADLAADGLLGGGYLKDIGTEAAGTPMLEMMVGVNPMTYTDTLSPLGKADNWKNFLNYDKNPILAASGKAANLTDTINRLNGYNSLLLQGVAPDEAARRMKRAHVDYESLTPAERRLRDQWVPFYTYTSRMLPEVLRQIAERPGGRYGQGLRLYENLQEGDEESAPPAELRRNFAVAVPDEFPVFGDSNPNYQRFFTTGNMLPGISELNTLQGGFTPANVMQNLAPIPRAGIELATGIDSFTKTPINAVSEGYGPYSVLARSIAGPDAGTGRLASSADRLIDIVPFLSTPARTAASLLGKDDERTFGSKAFDTAFNELGLGRFKTMSKDRIRDEQIRRLQQLAAPYTKDVSIPYIPKDQAHLVPQDAMDAFNTAREMRQEVQRDRRARRKAGMTSPFGGNPFIVQ